MTGTNHMLAGALIASLSKNPWVAFPVAFASHFVLDSLPHFGFKSFKDRNRKLLLGVIFVDAVIMLLLSVYIIYYLPFWYLLCSYVAVSPDIVWIYRIGIKEKLGLKAPGRMNFFNNFHSNIQHYERVWGIFLEIPLSILAFKLLIFVTK